MAGPPAGATPTETIETYYQHLRDGDPLAPFFADAETTVKFGVSEALWGGDSVADGLRAQTDTTADWAVDSQHLTVDDRAEVAWFADEVGLSWTDTDRNVRHEFDTRWSGTLKRVADGRWYFVGMHVSTAGDR
jgi:hypothetical protein